MHRQPVFQRCAVVGGGVAEGILRGGLCLPSGSNLSNAELERGAGVVRGCQGDEGQRREKQTAKSICSTQRR